MSTPQQTATPPQSEYQTYIASEAWAAQRRQAFDRWGRFCNVCATKEAIHVHHLFYRNYYDCIPEDLMPLCEGCHDALHARKPLPYSVSNQGDHFEKRRRTIEYVRTCHRVAAETAQKPSPVPAPPPPKQKPQTPPKTPKLKQRLTRQHEEQERQRLINALRSQDRRWHTVRFKGMPAKQLAQLLSSRANPLHYLPNSRVIKTVRESELALELDLSTRTDESLTIELAQLTHTSIRHYAWRPRTKLCAEIARIRVQTNNLTTHSPTAHPPHAPFTKS